MTHDQAADVANRAALFLSRLMREKTLKGKDKEDAADLAIDLALLAKHHQARHHLAPDPLPPMPS
jgi:hypothetical protein